jgi:peptide/nickel transport system substrate-binding protein
MKITDWSRHYSVKPTRSGEYTAQYYEFIGFNFRQEILQDKRLRQAIAYGFNADTHISDMYLSHAERAHSPVNPSSWLYNGEAPQYPYDPEQAAALLNNIWQEIPGLYAHPFHIITNAENPERIRTANALAESMKALGLYATVEIMEMDELTVRLSENEFDLFVGGYHLSLIPDLRFAFSTENVFSYQNADLDGLLTQAAGAYSDTAYYEILQDIQALIADDLPVISLAFLKSAVLTDEKVQGEIRPNAVNIFANINEWYIN